MGEGPPVREEPELYMPVPDPVVPIQVLPQTVENAEQQVRPTGEPKAAGPVSVPDRPQFVFAPRPSAAAAAGPAGPPPGRRSARGVWVRYPPATLLVK